MLKVRVVPTLLYKDSGLVKGVGFDSWRPVGAALQAVRVYNMRDVDELVFLDIGATPGGYAPDFDLVDELADDCFMPLTVGGGIHSAEDAAGLLAVGADKVCLGAVAVENPELVTAIAKRFGVQCVVVSVDCIDGGIATHGGTRRHERDPADFAAEMEDRGAGEILLQSVSRDGTMEGYDVECIQAVSSRVSIPVIASGGAGSPDHMAAALLEGGASAVAAASMYHFTEQTPREVKEELSARGIPVRL